MGIGHPTSDKP